jgi:hypothetical protein
LWNVSCTRCPFASKLWTRRATCRRANTHGAGGRALAVDDDRVTVGRALDSVGAGEPVGGCAEPEEVHAAADARSNRPASTLPLLLRRTVHSTVLELNRA